MATQPLYSGGGEEWMSVFGRNVRDASDAEKVQLIRAIQELTVQSSRAQSAAEKLLVEQEANRYDAAAKAAETLASLKKARMENDWHTFSIASENMRKIADVQEATIFKVAASEYAPFILKATKAKSLARENPNTAYWNEFISGLLETGKSPLGQDYVAELYTRATTGHNWRKELEDEGHGAGSYEYVEMEKLEKESMSIRESQKSLKGFLDRFDEYNKTGDYGKMGEEFDRMAGTPADSYLNTLNMGMDVDTLKAKAADLRSNKNTERLDQQIDFLNGLLKQSYGQGEDSPNYVNALKNEQYQAWAADRGLTIGKVTLDDAGNVVSVVKGKDDMRAARMYTNQMQRDPLAAQRRYRATKDVVRAEWTQGDQAAEELRDPTDNVKRTIIMYKDRDGGKHTLYQFSSGDGKTVRYFDEGAGTEVTAEKMASLMDPNTVPEVVATDTVLVEDGKLLSASKMSGDIKALNATPVVPKAESDKLFEKENSEKKAGKAGSPQFVDGIDLGIHARNGERVLLTAEGKRITVPKNAKVTKLDSLSPESAHTFDKLRAGRVNRGIANTDALTEQQKTDALGGLDEMSLAEKRAEAQRVKAEQEKAANEKATEATMPVVRKGDQADESGAVARDYDAYPGWREDDAAVNQASALTAAMENKNFSPMSTKKDAVAFIDQPQTSIPMHDAIEDMGKNSEHTSLRALSARNPTTPRTVVVAKHDLAKRMRPYLSQSELTTAPTTGDTSRTTRLSMRLGKRGEINAAARQKDIEKNATKRQEKENEEVLKRAEEALRISRESPAP